MTDTASPAIATAPSASRFLRLLKRPRIVGLACVVILADLGWTYLGLMLAGMLPAGQAAEFGPGMGLFDLLPLGLSGLGHALFDALCRPAFGNGAMAGAFGVAEFVLVLGMWCAMVLAMMLPTAGPMILTYADIAEAAAARREPVISPPTLAAGYVAVWLGFALAATALQWMLARLSLLDPSMGAVSGLFAGAILIGAGSYQFSAIKHACLTRCQRPFPFLFANWSAERRGVFRLGVRQGLDCLGCCWALMMVMFAVGVMNVVWMAALGLIMGIEKMSASGRFSRAIGVALVAIGALFVVSSVVGHWPARTG